MKLNLANHIAFFSGLPIIANGASEESTSIGLECKRACTQIASSFSSATYVLGNETLTVWDAKQQNVKSACRVLPITSEEVSGILHIIINESCNFAIKGGGHARYPDDSVSVGGVTIDMQKMKAIEISPDKSAVKLGSGHTLHSLYANLEKHNLTIIGGREGTVGLGGYVLGGGLSHLSPKYGLAMDNVFEYELVLPNATVVKVNQNTQPDLYFALRGGMNNFGIVTHFTMRAVRQGQIYAGARSYAADKRGDIIHQAYKLTTDWENDSAMSFYYGLGYNHSTDEYTVSFSPEYSKPISNPAPFEELKAISFETDTVRIGWASEFAEDSASLTPPGGRNLFSTVTYYPSPRLDKKIQDIMIEEIQSVKNIPGFYPNLLFQPLYEASIRAGKERGGNSAAIDADGPLTVVLLTVLWNNSDDDDAMNSFVGNWVEKATASIKEIGRPYPWLYINYASKEQDPFSGYGEGNMKRLRNIQKSIDPQGLFTSTGLCRGYFKVL